MHYNSCAIWWRLSLAKKKKIASSLHYTAYGRTMQKTRRAGENGQIYLSVLGGLLPAVEATSRGRVALRRIFAMSMVRRHWRLILGGLPVGLEIWRWITRVLEWAEHTEFVAHHIDDLKEIWALILEPPWWANGPLIAGGLLLIWLDLRRNRLAVMPPANTAEAVPIAPPEKVAVAASAPQVTRWFTPQNALDEFADKDLLAATVKALNEYRAARQAKDDHYKNLSPYEAVADRTNLSQQAQNAEIAFYATRRRLYENIINQLKQGILVGRALPFDDKKLVGNQDWETIKQSHWSVLRFSEGDMEDVSGGGRTYKGLQIGKPQ